MSLTALLSVSDKTGIVDFARALHRAGVGVPVAVAVEVVVGHVDGVLQAPRLELRAEFAVTRLEERPVEESLVRHGQFPSNFGRCLAANAS